MKIAIALIVIAIVGLYVANLNGLIELPALDPVVTEPAPAPAVVDPASADPAPATTTTQ